jgi:hypothetical protein
LSAFGQKEKTNDFRDPDRRQDRQALHLQVGRRLPLQPVRVQKLQLLSNAAQLIDCVATNNEVRRA